MTSTTRTLTAIGLTTWLASGAPTLVAFVSKGVDSPRQAALWGGAFVLFGALFWGMTRTRRHALGALTVASTLALVVSACGRGGFDPILLVIVAGVAGGRLSVAGQAVLVTVQTVALGSIDWMRFGSASLPMVAAYSGFMVFAAVTATIAEHERRARVDLATANAELKTALALLDVSTRAAERARIGRDLHDVIGHHLTALSLQLEVALHSPVDGRELHLQKAQAIAKLLLSDVRAIVSDLRSEKPIDLIRALDLLVSAISRPHIEVLAPDSLLLADPVVAQTTIRCLQEIITNASRHSSARRLTLRLEEAGPWLEISAHDDGVGVSEIVPGNGLTGMRERVESSGGSLRLGSAPGEGFSVHFRLPLGDLQ